MFYLIKWEGYPSSQNTWEAENNVFSETLIKEFEDRERSKANTVDDEFTPTKSPVRASVSPKRSPLKNQKAEVVSVKTVTRDQDTGELQVHCIMYIYIIQSLLIILNLGLMITPKSFLLQLLTFSSLK